MKKTFFTTAPNKKPDRQVEAIRYEIKKYLARERRKPLPEGADFWDFDCRFGLTQEDAKEVAVHEIKACITEHESAPSFYVEILAKPGKKPPNNGESSD